MIWIYFIAPSHCKANLAVQTQAPTKESHSLESKMPSFVTQWQIKVTALQAVAPRCSELKSEQYSPWLAGLPLGHQNDKVPGLVACCGARGDVVDLLLFTHSLQDLTCPVKTFSTHLRPCVCNCSSNKLSANGLILTQDLSFSCSTSKAGRLKHLGFLQHLISTISLGFVCYRL